MNRELTLNNADRNILHKLTHSVAFLSTRQTEPYSATGGNLELYQTETGFSLLNQLITVMPKLSNRGAEYTKKKNCPTILFGKDFKELVQIPFLDETLNY